VSEQIESRPSRQARQTDRRAAIAAAVMRDGTVRIDQLADMFGTSLMTMHRDLDELAARGLLRKSRGLATASPSSVAESSDVYREARESAEKEQIAVAALGLVNPGEALFLDDSTTVLHLARHLETKRPLTIITNVLTHLNELRSAREIELIALGGTYYNWCNAYMGPGTLAAIGDLRADTLFMSTAAVTDMVCFHQSSETASVKRAMFEAAERRVLLVDHTKFGRRALHRVAALRDFDTVVVDSNTPRGLIADIRAEGVEVVVGHPARPVPSN
jgi:DeoR/GlpR family transcriptional regulator of sugar metabolism